MNYFVHLKNEAGRDDLAVVEADSAIAAEGLAMNQNPTAVATIDAYPAWEPKTVEEDGWAR